MTGFRQSRILLGDPAKDIFMTRQVIRTEKAPAPVGPYNQAIVATGKMVFVAGQIAIDPVLGDVVHTTDITKPVSYTHLTLPTKA